MSRNPIFTFCSLLYTLYRGFWISRPYAPWAFQEKQSVRTCSTLTLLNLDFGGQRTKSAFSCTHKFFHQNQLQGSFQICIAITFKSIMIKWLRVLSLGNILSQFHLHSSKAVHMHASISQMLQRSHQRENHQLFMNSFVEQP